MNPLQQLIVRILLLVIFIAPGASGADEEPGAPGAALTAYYQALKSGDTEAASKLTASFKSIPAGYLEKYTAKYAEGAKAGKLVIVLVPGASKVERDCAVVVFKDGDKERPDYDPAYLLKQDGAWKVLLKLTQWDHRAFDLTADQKTRFAALEQWFDKEKDRLYGR